MNFSKRKRNFPFPSPQSPITQLLAACVITMSLTSCVGPKKIDKWIGEQYGETTASNKPKANYFTITSPLVTADSKTSNSVKEKTKVLPLIFYWQFDYKISSSLNPKVPMNLFVSAFTSYANSKGLKQKLNGQKLEMTIDKMPTAFSFHDDFRDINLLLAQIHWEKIYIAPENADVAISYKLTKDNGETKSGVINIADRNKIKQKKYLQRLKTATQDYLAQYDENIRSMAKTAVDKVLLDL